MSTNTNPAPTKLMTSLNEIRKFNPCASGWRDLMSVHGTRSYEDQFPLEDCLLSNSVADMLWLIGKRKVEIEIAVKAAKKFAESVEKYDNREANRAAAYAEAAYAEADADAAADAATCAAYAATCPCAAYAAQCEINKQILLTCIREYEQTKLNNQGK